MFIIDQTTYADDRSKELLANSTAFAQRNTLDPLSICDDYEVVADALESGIPVLITGEPGTGKTSLILILGARYGVPVWLTPCNGSMTAAELIGKVVFNTHEGVDGDVRKTIFVPGPLLWCFVKGGVVLLDDGLQLTSAAMTAAMEFAMLPDIYNCAANGVTYKRHPNFRIVMTGNLGCVGTNKVPEALLDRFAVAIDIDRLSRKSFLLLGKTKWGYLRDDFFNIAYDLCTAVMTEAKSNAKKHVPCGFRQMLALMGLIPDNKVIALTQFARRVKTTFVAVLRKALMPSEKVETFYRTGAVQGYITAMYNAYRASPRPKPDATSAPQPTPQPQPTAAQQPQNHTASQKDGQGLCGALLGVNP